MLPQRFWSSCCSMSAWAQGERGWWKVYQPILLKNCIFKQFTGHVLPKEEMKDC